MSSTGFLELQDMGNTKETKKQKNKKKPSDYGDDSYSNLSDAHDADRNLDLPASSLTSAALAHHSSALMQEDENEPSIYSLRKHKHDHQNAATGLESLVIHRDSSGSPSAPRQPLMNNAAGNDEDIKEGESWQLRDASDEPFEDESDAEDNGNIVVASNIHKTCKYLSACQ